MKENWRKKMPATTTLEGQMVKSGRRRQSDLPLNEEQDLIVNARNGCPAAIELLVSLMTESALGTAPFLFHSCSHLLASVLHEYSRSCCGGDKNVTNPGAVGVSTGAHPGEGGLYPLPRQTARQPLASPGSSSYRRTTVAPESATP